MKTTVTTPETLATHKAAVMAAASNLADAVGGLKAAIAAALQAGATPKQIHAWVAETGRCKAGNVNKHLRSLGVSQRGPRSDRGITRKVASDLNDAYNPAPKAKKGNPVEYDAAKVAEWAKAHKLDAETLRQAAALLVAKP